MLKWGSVSSRFISSSVARWLIDGSRAQERDIRLREGRKIPIRGIPER
jgi:hypothetical protein